MLASCMCHGAANANPFKSYPSYCRHALERQQSWYTADAKHSCAILKSPLARGQVVWRVDPPPGTWAELDQSCDQVVWHVYPPGTWSAPHLDAQDTVCPSARSKPELGTNSHLLLLIRLDPHPIDIRAVRCTVHGRRLACASSRNGEASRGRGGGSGEADVQRQAWRRHEPKHRMHQKCVLEFCDHSLAL